MVPNIILKIFFLGQKMLEKLQRKEAKIGYFLRDIYQTFVQYDENLENYCENAISCIKNKISTSKIILLHCVTQYYP